MQEPIRKHWFADDPFRTLIFNSFSVSVPQSERFFVATTRIARLRLNDETLIGATDVLIHEEEAHTRVHEAYNDLLRRQGYAIGRFERFEARVASLLAKRSLRTRLALCLCGEFFTAVMGRHLLEKRICELEGVDERMRALWTWHSLEELHHRGTGYDLYLAAGGGYFRRIGAMAVIGTFYLVLQFSCFLGLMRQDQVRLTFAEWRAGWQFLLGRDGFYRAVLVALGAFIKPGFHPDRDLRVDAELVTELIEHAHIEDKFVRAVQGR